MAAFDSRAYWEDRLSNDYSITGVGFRRLGPSFNEWAYRLRRERFTSIVREQGLDLPACDVLDIGSGTGFYLAIWEELGIRSVTGSDLTDAAVKQLQLRYPDMKLLQLDIAEPLTESLKPGSFDVVDAMDVLFHIIEDDRFANAIANIHSLLKPGGLFIWTDVFIHHVPVNHDHIVGRRLADIERVMADSGFEIVRRAPMFFLMNTPVDTTSKLAKSAWLAAAGFISLWDGFGKAAGRAIYPIEKRLIEKRTESPATEIMICRKI